MLFRQTDAPSPAGPWRSRKRWPGLTVEYAWLPPFAGHALTKPNRIEVVFSAHRGVALELGGQVHDVLAQPGGTYVVGAEPTTLLKVGEYSDTLEMYPDAALLSMVAAQENLRAATLQPTWPDQHAVTFARVPAVVGAAHRLRQACVGRATLSDIEASTLAHQLARWALTSSQGEHPPPTKQRSSRLDERLLARITDYIEAKLGDDITLEELAGLALLSPWHFARSFKRSVGLAPHQYVLARRIDWAKRQLLSSRSTIEDVAWSVGFENMSHFRRCFSAHLGVLPAALRRAAQSGLAR